MDLPFDVGVLVLGRAFSGRVGSAVALRLLQVLAKSRHLRGECASFASVLSCPSCVGFFADTYGSLLLPGRRRRVECTPERPLCAPLRRSIRGSFL